MAIGCQYRRSSSPPGVPGPTRVSRSFSSLLSMALFLLCRRLAGSRRRARPEHGETLLGVEHVSLDVVHDFRVQAVNWSACASRQAAMTKSGSGATIPA